LNNLPEAKRLSTDAWIEKIQVLGVHYWPRSVTLKYEGTVTSLTHKLDEGNRCLTIRRPGMAVDKDWQIEISP